MATTGDEPWPCVYQRAPDLNAQSNFQHLGQLRSHHIRWQQQCHIILSIYCKFLPSLCGTCDSKCPESVNAAPRTRRGGGRRRRGSHSITDARAALTNPGQRLSSSSQHLCQIQNLLINSGDLFVLVFLSDMCSAECRRTRASKPNPAGQPHTPTMPMTLTWAAPRDRQRSRAAFEIRRGPPRDVRISRGLSRDSGARGRDTCPRSGLPMPCPPTRRRRKPRERTRRTTERGGRADGDRVADLPFLSRCTVHVSDDTVSRRGRGRRRRRRAHLAFEFLCLAHGQP